MAAILRAIGVISGTSMDGIDVALVESDGEAELRPGPGASHSPGTSTRRAAPRVLAYGRSIIAKPGHCQPEADCQWTPT